jgi:predicted ester cyclase
MSTEENKATIYHLIEELNKGNSAAIDECFADNFVRYGQGVPNMDKAGYKRFYSMIIKGSPDLQTKIDDIVAEGDRVAFRMTLTGTNTGESFGKPPTGKQFSITEDYFVRFEGGKIVEFKNLIGAGPA